MSNKRQSLNFKHTEFQNINAFLVQTWTPTTSYSFWETTVKHPKAKTADLPRCLNILSQYLWVLSYPGRHIPIIHSRILQLNILFRIKCKSSLWLIYLPIWDVQKTCNIVFSLKFLNVYLWQRQPGVFACSGSQVAVDLSASPEFYESSEIP